MHPLPARLDIEALHRRLCQRIAAIQPPVVADVMRVFLEVSSLECEQALWSLEFVFDEDEGRIARLEARFVDRTLDREPSDEPLPGYEVRLLLPRLIPPRTLTDGEPTAAHGLVMGDADRSLVARFVRALTDLGAYRTIEPLTAVTAEAHLL